MTLPKHIQEGIDKSKELQEQLINGNTDPAPVDDDVMKQDGAVVDPPIENEDYNPPQKDEGTPSKEEAPAKDKSKDIEHWKQKFRTLEGKYNAEVPRYASEVRELKSEIESLQRSLLQIQEEKKAEMEAPTTGDIDPAAYEEYGEEIQKLVTETVWLKKQLKTLSAENNKLKQGYDEVSKTAEDTSFNTFLDKVREKFPAFDEQDSNPEFLDWVSRMGIDLVSIGKKRDVNKAVEVYKTYSDLTTPKATPEKDIEIEDEKKPVDRVKRQVAPPRSRPALPKQEEKGWTREGIEQFYKDVKTGKYTEKEAYALKRQLFQAQAEGKVS